MRRMPPGRLSRRRTSCRLKLAKAPATGLLYSPQELLAASLQKFIKTKFIIIASALIVAERGVA
jgi:hypothetical protein